MAEMFLIVVRVCPEPDVNLIDKKEIGFERGFRTWYRACKVCLKCKSSYIYSIDARIFSSDPWLLSRTSPMFAQIRTTAMSG